MKLGCGYALGLLLLTFGRTAPAAERGLDLFDLGAPAFTTFSPRDGVPESVIVDVQTDRQGYVWLASPQGLARYDGDRWNAVEAPVPGAMPVDLMLDHAGILWASFHDHGIGHYDGTRWQVDDRANGRASDQVRRVVETVRADGAYELWALTWDAGLLLHQADGDWKREPGSEALPAGALLSVARTHGLGGGERLWVGTYNEGLWYRQDGAWQRLREGGFDPSQIESLLATNHDGVEALWIITYGLGLWRLDAHGLRAWTKESGELPSNELYAAVETALPGGRYALWVATRSGLVRVYDDRTQTFDRRHGLPSDVVRGLRAWHSPEGSDVLWLATESGVARTQVGANRWTTASLLGASGSGVFGVRVEPDGHGGERLWVASTADGLGLYEDGHWRRFSPADGTLPDTDVRTIVRVPDTDGSDTLMVGMRYGHLARVRPGPRFDTVPVPWEHHAGQAVMDILGRRVDGRLERWFATRQSGIYRWRDGEWTAFRPEGTVGQWRTVRLLEQVDAHGTSWLWATSNQGLARYDGKKWTLLTAGLPDTDLRGITLLPDAHGRAILWLGSVHSGVVRVDATDPLQLRVLPNDLPPAPDPTAYGAVSDSQGRIYICTNNGVQQLTPTPDGYATRVFSRRDGMVHEECNTNAQFVDAHDRFWTGTLGGLTVFDPEGEVRDTHPKPLVLTEVRVDGAAVEPRDVHVAPGAHEVRVDFGLLSWQRENESRFRTQLVGYEALPGPWVAQNFRSYGALPPGSYVLRIEGRDYAGNVSGPIELSLEMVPTWWQRGSSRALLALAALLLVYVLLQWRTRNLKAQRRRLEHEVAERTAKLHEANARLLELSYKDALTGLANRRRLLESLERGGGAAAGAPTALIFVDVDHFKDYNDRYGHPAGDEALRCVADVIRECAPAETLVARYGGEEFACVMPGADTDAARTLAERFRAGVAARPIPVPGTDAVNRVTISAGVASARLDTDAEAHRLLRAADAALYQAKHDGRDCVRG